MSTSQKILLNEDVITNKDKWLRENQFSTFILASLRGISQIILIENAITGLIMLLAITVSSYVLGIVALLSAFIGTIIGKLGGADENAVKAGLFGYNSVLTGIALTIFLGGSFHWIIALVGAGIAAILTAALMHFIKGIEIPILTFPFVVLTWLMLLVSYQFNTFKLGPGLIPQNLSDWTLDLGAQIIWLDGFLRGISQIFLLDHLLSAILFFVAIFWAGWKYGVYAVIGNAVALITAYGLGADHSSITLGLYGYNAILTIIAVSIVFNPNNSRFALLSGIIGACLTVLITAGVSTLLLPYGISALTIAFVLSSWIMLGARKILPQL
ncbi:urea transporter [Oceanobacillus sp. FSL K6-2867]|uniref:urea transporter n=1 Tax=Oceanobacillus sp. FSL K6-2867 TaxID=2954748 RepID=UPI0030DBBFD4